MSKHLDLGAPMNPVKTLLIFSAMSSVACTDPVNPQWNVDLLFPLRFPDVAIQDFTPTNVLPATDIPFTAPQEVINVDGVANEVLSLDSIVRMTAAFILSTNSPVAGAVELSVATSPANLFSPNPSLALTVQMEIRRTAGDTTKTTPNVALFQNASVLYVQSRGSIRSATGGDLAISSADVLEIGVNLTVRTALVR